MFLNGTVSSKSVKQLPLHLVEIDPACQIRHELDQQAIEDFRKTLDVLPPVRVVFERKSHKYWLYDGFHRVQAHKLENKEEIAVEIVEGDRDDAIVLSISANKENKGVRLTNKDLHRAIRHALKAVKLVDKSNCAIAKLLAVDEKMVRRIRKKMEEAAEIRKAETIEVERKGKKFSQKKKSASSARADDRRKKRVQENSNESPRLESPDDDYAVERSLEQWAKQHNLREQQLACLLLTSRQGFVQETRRELKQLLEDLFAVED